MALKSKGKRRVVSFATNMSVSVMSKLPKEDAYWCAPGCLQGKLPKDRHPFTSYLWSDTLGFKLPDEVTIRLDYPFDTVYEEKVNLLSPEGHRYDSIGELLWHAAQVYKRAYKDANAGNNGYFHGMGDLVFEGVNIYEDGVITFDMGS